MRWREYADEMIWDNKYVIIISIILTAGIITVQPALVYLRED